MDRQADHTFQTLLFDLEGTLVDFQWDLKGAAKEVKKELSQLGFEPSSWEDNYATLRNNAVRLAAQVGLEQQVVADRIGAIYDRYDQSAASRWSLMPEAKTVLSYLRDGSQVKLGLVTNIGRKAVEYGTTKLGLAGLFDVVITRDDVEWLKPSGDGIRLAIAKLESQTSATLFIGDSVTDVLAARDAGVKVAIVQGGESAPTSLAAASPSYLWSTLGELKSLHLGGEHTK